jgi:hypothetical protein
VFGLLGLAVVACSPAREENDEGAAALNGEQPTFDLDDVLDDASLQDAEAMTAEQVQNFLDAPPTGTRSVLATYNEGGRSAASIMVDTALKYDINPLELLVRVQMEQSLIGSATAASSRLGAAFGCGCPDEASCIPRFKGFVNQANCAAETLSLSMARARTAEGTRGGWAIQKSKNSRDGLSITPKNAATAALYTYTPWVGEAGGGKKGIGGSSLHFAIWNRFASAVGYTSPRLRGTVAVTAPPARPPESPPAPPNPNPNEPAPANPSDDGAAVGPIHGADAGTPPPANVEELVLATGSNPPITNAPAGVIHRSFPQLSDAELDSSAREGAGCAVRGSMNSHSSSIGVSALACAAMIVAARRRRAPNR